MTQTSPSNWYDSSIYCQREDVNDPFYGLLLKGWYFQDETWSPHGPFATREEAIEAIKNYADEPEQLSN